jgi:hypothetical protein
MSDAVGKFPRSAGEDTGDAVGDRDSHASNNNAGQPAPDVACSIQNTTPAW